MKQLLFAFLVVALPVPVVWGICDLPPPPPTDDKWDPSDTPTDPPVPPPPGTPSPEAPPTPTRTDPRGGARTRPRTASANYAPSWHLWWELNREHLLGLRGSLKRRDVVTPGRQGGTRTLEVTRSRVREALRKVGTHAERADLRAAALRALGRAGNDEDARLFLRLLRSHNQPHAVLEAAAIGLGCLPRIEDEEVRREIRKFFDTLLAGRLRLPGRARLLATMTVSLRAREDPTLAWSLVSRCNGKVGSANEAAALLYGCGLARHAALVPTLMEAARTSRLGSRRLHDVARSHATLALAMSDDPGAAAVLVKLLRSRRVQVHTRRSAALGLGLVLRTDRLHERMRAKVEHALWKAFRGDRDPLVQGFCAVGMGTARRPFGLAALIATVGGSGNEITRPYAALALGLAAPRLDAEDARDVRRFLFREFAKARNIQRAAALSIAVGLSGTKEAKDHLFDRLARKRLKASMRGPAIQGLGLLGETDRRIEQTLVKALDDGSDEVVEDAALALGLLGTRTTARLLVDKLVRTRSESVQAHMVAALSHLGGTSAVEPLLAVLADTSLKHTVRESAAAALGILVGVRDHDPLFEIDAHSNPYALTTASRELVLAY